MAYAPGTAKPEWDAWYKSSKWRRVRLHQLRLQPFCQLCAARGVVSLATVVDHIEPHHGDWDSFWLGPFQSLCAPCHDSAKRLLETRGYSHDVGVDGWPIDPKHPANAGKIPGASGLSADKKALRGGPEKKIRPFNLRALRPSKNNALDFGEG